MSARELADRLSKEFADQGKLIEAGWIAMKVMSIPADAPQVQIDEMRNAFFAGAQHLFSSLMVVLADDHEPTDDDLNRMTLIDRELREFVEQMKRTMG